MRNPEQRDSHSKGPTDCRTCTWRVLNLEDLDAALNALEAYLQVNRQEAPRATKARLIAEELIANGLQHRTNAESPVVLSAIIDPTSQVTTIEVHQPGPKFDSANASNIPPLDPERLGGHGLRIAHANARALRHRYRSEINIIAFEV